jgi:hypothetical protein
MNKTTSIQLDIRLCFIGAIVLASLHIPLMSLKYELNTPLYLSTLYLLICEVLLSLFPL